MAEKDQLEALKKLNTRARSTTTGTTAPLPEAGKPLHAGSAADLQGNVGNSGLKQMIDQEAGQKAKAPIVQDVSRMGPNELAAHAKQAGKQVATSRGDEKSAKVGAASGKGEAEAKQKEATALAKEAERAKADATREKKTAADKKAGAKGAKGAKDLKATGVEAKLPDGKKDKKSEAKAQKKSDKKAAKKADKLAGKEVEKAGKPKQAEAKTGDKKKVAEAKDRASEKTAKKGGKSLKGADQGVAEVADKKSKAKESRADASQAKAKVALEVAAKGGKESKNDDKAKLKVAANKEKKALKAEVEAEQGDKKQLDKKKAGAAAKAAPEVTTTAKKGSGKGEDKAKTGDKTDPTLDAKKDPKAAAAAATVESRTLEADLAAKKLTKVEDEKVKAEGKADAVVDPAKSASAATELEAKAKEEDATAKVTADKVEAEEKARIEAESPANNATMEEISRSADLDRVDGDRVTLIGTYVPRPAPGGSQMLGHVSLLIGTTEVRLGLETRATAELLRLAGERVAVTGTLDLKRASSEQATDPKKAEKPVLTRPGAVATR